MTGPNLGGPSSATPQRQYDEGFVTRVAPVLGDVIFRYTYAEARVDGVIAPFDLINYRVPLTKTEQEQYDRLTRSIARAMRQSDGEGDERLRRLLLKRAGISLT